MLIIALWMRYDFSVDHLAVSLGTGRFYAVLTALVVVTWAAGWFVGLYRGRFVPGSVLETSVLTLVFAVASVAVFLGHILAGQHQEVPRSTPIIAGAFTTLTALVLRSFVRRKRLFGAGTAKDAERALVFGAGDGGLQLVRQLRRSEGSQFNPVGVLDDDAKKRHMVIEGVRVHGGRERLEDLASRTGASTLLIAVPSLPSDELIDIRDRAEAAGLRVLVLPPLDSMMRGRVAVNELREINVNDLLGRKPAQLNQTQIAEYLRGKRILVTGAGGSIGSELCRQLSRFRPAELMMLDRDESGLHAVQLSINDQAMLDGDDTILASIRDRETIEQIFEQRRPQIVFHAAALKHMPLLEQYPLEAVKTNVLGTLNVLDAAQVSGVETFVNISTDKAANPCSALGTSKRIAERLTASKSAIKGSTKFVSVRFGNVLGSRGSVLTVFEKQILRGGPVTVTDPEVNRFFMTIPEACQLVLQAAVVGESGETLVLDMGDPIKIADVARTLIEQSGKVIDIVYTGLRASEKMAEKLFDDTETPIRSQRHDSLFVVGVPAINIDRNEVEALGACDNAGDWLTANTYSGGADPSTSLRASGHNDGGGPSVTGWQAENSRERST
ncbi:nucleoside-diphosphate sugar epimerase/dehydratase [Dietzia sp. PP-33]|uniref:polysaccharide biosynthesis protein n=1 Tax=Dietzia sp. PP-33 TaxID=2957500 RepID=UPI0029ACD84E|nr:nucleoside-diphosphate sugar epimerase/dehydratase [Dietzia sp. PP-33]MDX2358779.1 polysaccharide biosynthesis protein [Dietzia sp. PP-33]